MVDVHRSSVYLVDLAGPRIYPISFRTYTGMEQVQANQRGQWLLYQKYGVRVLAFLSN